MGSVNGFQRILVATDFSPASSAALEQAVKVASAAGAELLIAHTCKEPGPPETGFLPEAAYEDWKRAARTQAQNRLQPLLEQVRRQGVAARALVLRGFPEEALVDAARKHGADLIVLGTHGRRGAERFFLGSVAARVASTAGCPVMTVRAPRDGAAVTTASS